MAMNAEQYIKMVTAENDVNKLGSLPFIEVDQLGEFGKTYAASYKTSKLALNRVTQLLSKDSRLSSKKISVVSVCPGWCKTDMGGQAAPRSPEAGADSIFWCITAAKGPEGTDINGGFFSDGKVLEW